MSTDLSSAPAAAVPSRIAIRREDIPIYLVIAVLTALLFGIDALLPLGITVWVFYMVPVVLTVLQRNRYLPLIVAIFETVFIVAGTYLPLGEPVPLLNLANRGFGILTIAISAALALQSINSRLRADRLLWLQRGEGEVAQSVMGEQGLAELANNAVYTIARYLDAQVGTLHRLDHGALVALGSYGGGAAQTTSEGASPGATAEGLAMEAATRNQVIVVRDLPPDYLKIRSATGSARPAAVVIAPVVAEGRVVGVMELGFTRADGDFADEVEVMRQAGEPVGVALRAAMYRDNLKALLEETRRQSEELQTQQEELRAANEELEEQGRVLRESQGQLEHQQSELLQTNAHLEEQTQHLERQKRELQAAQHTLEINAQELRRASRYKSEFLANMSHELRTPLNSSLILAQMLADPKSARLPAEEVQRYARTIHAANSDLLTLINDILDLSKIEAGHVDVEAQSVSLAGILEPVRQMFEPIASHKQLRLHVEIDPGAPATFTTDPTKLQQVLKNLLANAFKFTERGQVTLRVSGGSAARRIAFAVIDTGIGIAEQHQQAIFEAFQQADGTTSRKYGGTGLGLSISRELARLLGGEIRVQSAEGAGSTFTLEIAADLQPSIASATATPSAGFTTRAPVAAAAYRSAPGRPAAASADNPTRDGVARPGSGSSSPAAADGAATIPAIQPKGDFSARRHERLILVIEDDDRFADVLYDLAHELGYDCVSTSTGSDALRLARELQPQGILLDVSLPDQSGLTVLDQIKRDPGTRHIPIHMISVHDHVQAALEMGAIGYAIKPVAREELLQAFARLEEKLQLRPRRVLVVEDDEAMRQSIALLLRADDIEITLAGTAAEALEHVAARTFDCMVMDLMLPDASGYELLENMAAGGRYAFPPVIVYTGRALARDEEQRLRRYSGSIIIKGAKSPERLVDEVTLFLHRVESSLPPDQQKLLLQARQRDAVFEGRRILLVEDDVRNIFALSSVLEPLGAEILISRNGREALDQLARDGNVDIVLMDLMMPEMDGLTATREIRKQPAMQQLPIIALTAKAMGDDRRNCLEAGANDYIAKPIDVDKLVSLCRVWMPK
jgi:CheY-like chemotaxis protein